MGKLKEKIIEKGSGLVAKSKTKKQLEKVLPKPLAKQISKKVGKESRINFPLQRLICGVNLKIVITSIFIVVCSYSQKKI